MISLPVPAVLPVSEPSFPLMTSSLALSQRAFESGETDLMDVLTARGQLLMTERDVLSVYAEYYAAIAELESAAGVELVAPTDREASP